jgi:hypothetical protein
MVTFAEPPNVPFGEDAKDATKIEAPLRKRG